MTRTEAHEVVKSPEVPEVAAIVSGNKYVEENIEGSVYVANWPGATVASPTKTPPIESCAVIGAPPPVLVTETV